MHNPSAVVWLPPARWGTSRRPGWIATGRMLWCASTLCSSLLPDSRIRRTATSHRTGRTGRVDQAQQLVASRDHTPALADADRELLGDTLGDLRREIGECGGAEQLLHGEPHPGNVLTTKNGLLFIDLETCCRGPVEFDLAHAPEEVSGLYPGANHHLLRDCRILALAMITTWRWDRGDQVPNGRRLGTDWLDQIRTALERRELNIPADLGISRTR